MKQFWIRNRGKHFWFKKRETNLNHEKGKQFWIRQREKIFNQKKGNISELGKWKQFYIRKNDTFLNQEKENISDSLKGNFSESGKGKHLWIRKGKQFSGNYSGGRQARKRYLFVHSKSIWKWKFLSIGKIEYSVRGISIYL